MQQPPTDYAVSVTPDGGSEPQRSPNSGPYTTIFTVTNTGALDDEFRITCTGQAPVTCSSVSPSYVALGSGASVQVEAQYSVAAAGQGRITVRAMGQTMDETDTGYRIVPVVGAQLRAPLVTRHNFNGDNQDRSLCLTVGAGQAAGLACGDLFVVHGMPAYRTMGRDRSLTLFYSSSQATPRPTVAVWVSQPSGTQTPNSVFAKLTVGGVVRDSATYSAWGSSSGPRQLVLGYDASSDTSGLYDFSLEVRNQYTEGPQSTTIRDTLIVVNRSASDFGAGWWLAGVEQLLLNRPANKILWVDGDGSAAVYRPINSTTWVRAAGAFRDTLTLVDTVYTRRLRHGVQVKFNGAGHHIQTIGRTGQTTTFRWPVTAPLSSIQVPPAVSGTTYTLVYDGSGKLDYITDPAGRVLNATVSSGNLIQLTDPDTVGVTFAYDAAHRLTSRTGRGGSATMFRYSVSSHVDTVIVPLSATDTAVTTMAWWDEEGLAIGSPGSTQSAVDTALAYSKVLGPLLGVDDDATFWVDRWGAPVRIVGAVYDTTVVARDSITGLVTMVRNPVHDSVTATYTERGNLASIVDNTFEGPGTLTSAGTTYVYGTTQVPDSPTEVRSPVDTTSVHYDTALGMPDSATAQGGARTAFNYLRSGLYRGLLQSVVAIGVRVVDTTNWTRTQEPLVTVLYHDLLGNDTAIALPSGAVTRGTRDQYGRVSSAYDRAGHRTDYWYDLLNRMTVVWTYDSGAVYSTTYSYLPSGPLWRVRDSRGVKQQWSYDAALRPISMTDEAGATELRFFNRAGQVDSVRTRAGSTITSRYDAGGRLISTRYPAMTHSFNRSDQNRTIVGDSITRAYDASGRLSRAVRARDTLAFEWNREGSLRSERQLLRSPSGVLLSDFTARYWTDVGGRRAKFYNGTDTLRYTYGSDGYLSSLAVQWMASGSVSADTFRFTWDALGRRDSVVYVGPSVYVSYGYDRDGNLRLVCSRHPGNPYNSDYLENVLHVKTVTADGLPTSWEQQAGGNPPPGTDCTLSLPNQLDLSPDVRYDARHQMILDNTLRYSYDASGNRVARYWRSNGTLMDILAYYDSTNRLGSMPTIKWYLYDGNGALHEEHPTNEAIGNWRLYYYNSLGETLGHKAFVPAPGGGYQWVGDSVLFHYDPLGRRVSGETGAWLGFDGENAVRDIGGSGLPIWRFVHGPGIDDPLVGLYQNSPGQFSKYYYLTDGRGRLLAFTAADGSNRMDSPDFTQQGGALAGAIVRSRTFENGRMEVPGAPQLSFYRNRYYDQQTGRWTQEDPIGVAGGLNLYNYVGNNPATFTDPFGLCKEAPGSGNTPCDLIKLVFAEASSENSAGMQAVGSVVRNRVDDRQHDFRNRGTYERVIHQSAQFRGVGNDQWKLATAQMASAGHDVLTGPNLTAYNQAVSTATGIFNRTLGDNTGGSLFFAKPDQFGAAVNKYLADGVAEKFDVQGDLNQHEFVRFK
jgi:RHS repeat-associated protein